VANKETADIESAALPPELTTQITRDEL
jgi:hypothetical protein